MANPHIKTHTDYMSFRVPPALKSAAKERAARAGMKLSPYVAMLIAQDAERPDLLPEGVDDQQGVLDLGISA